VTNVSAAIAPGGGRVDGTVGESTEKNRHQRDVMTATSATATGVRTGGPQDDGPKILEHAMGWILVVVLAMLVTRLGLL